MGVAGSGKTAVARRLAHARGAEFADSDDFHPSGNVAKMAAGVPLDDADRLPWLDRVAEWLAAERVAGRSAVLACSALKRRYRDRLRAAEAELMFIHLVVPESILLRRLERRVGHFMPVTLLASQLAAFEALGEDERGIEVDASGALDAIAAEVLQRLA